MAIKLLVDSCADITQEEAQKMGISVIPLQITIDDKEYLDGINLSVDEFYEKLTISKSLPKTSQINPYRYEEAFEKLTENGDEVICITLSSGCSGTYASAKIASENFNGKVHVVDSLNVAMGERILVEYAIKLLSNNKTVTEIVEELERVKSKIKILAVVDTLEYLKKGGRISVTTAFAGELLNIKPIVSIIDGKVEMIGKARGSKRAFNFINEYIENCGGIDYEMPYSLLYSGSDDSKVEKYREFNKDVWANIEMRKQQIGCTIGTHAGPGAVGIAFFEK